MSDEINDEVAEDVEGHGFRTVEDAGETEGHGFRTVEDAGDDVEGHRAARA